MTWGRYPDLSKGDVSFINAQKNLKKRFHFWEKKLKDEVRNYCNKLVFDKFSGMFFHDKQGSPKLLKLGLC